jgi:uncharacterized membrane protein YdbT with pleckstrin-like domain
MVFEKITLETDEVILTTVRRHWFYLCIYALPLVFLAVVPPLFYLVCTILFSEITSQVTGLYTPQVLFLYSLWLLCLTMVLTSVWTDYYLDIWSVTNKRIIKIDQAGLFRRKTGSFRLERMQDVNVEVNGIIATLLDYGTVHVQTASADLEEFKALYLPNPQNVKSIILEAGDTLMKLSQNKDTASL